jgi:hypothetical protein
MTYSTLADFSLIPVFKDLEVSNERTDLERSMRI